MAVVGVLVFLSDKLLGGQWRAGGGDLMLLVAASFFSYYTVAAKPLIERHGGVVVMTYATLLGSVPVVALSLPAGLQVDWAAVTPCDLGRHALRGADRRPSSAGWCGAGSTRCAAWRAPRR